MRVAIVGSRGQLGTALLASAPENVEVRGLSRDELDVTVANATQLDSAIAGCDVVINASAYTNVDAAETDRETAFAVNAEGPGRLAEACQRKGAHFIHVSTDYVFGSSAPRRPLQIDDEKAPDTVYGQSKLAGEQAVLAAHAKPAIVRTAWLFTGDLQPHKDFVSTMLRLARQGTAARVVDDQRGNPTSAVDLAQGLWQVAARRVSGIYHGVGAGDATWFELARETYVACGADPALVTPCTTADFPRPAPRPAWSVLDTSSWLSADLPPFPEWRTSVRRAVSTKL